MNHVQICRLSKPWVNSDSLDKIYNTIQDLKSVRVKNNEILDKIIYNIHYLLNGRYVIIYNKNTFYKIILITRDLMMNKMTLFQQRITKPSNSGCYNILSTRIVEITF